MRENVSNNDLHLSFYLRNDRANQNGCPVLFKMARQGEVCVLSTGHRVPPEYWTNRQRASLKLETSGVINVGLEQLVFKTRLIHQQLSLASRPFSLSDIKDRIQGKHLGWQTTVEEYWEAFIQELKASIGISCSKALFEKEKRALKYFKQCLMCHTHRDNIRIAQITPRHINRFYLFLRQEKNLAHNTAIKTMQLLKKLIKNAMDDHIIHRDPFRKFSLSLEETVPQFLSIHQIQAIRDKCFVIERLELVKNLFLFACYTGLTYSDILSLQYRHIQWTTTSWILMKRKKTKVLSQIPLLPDAMIILDKYSDPTKSPFDTVFPQISNQKLNAYLKEIADLCGIPVAITFHMARHTFATTIALRNGLSLESLSTILGHKNLKSTQHYAKIMNDRLEEEMRVVAERLIL